MNFLKNFFKSPLIAPTKRNSLIDSLILLAVIAMVVIYKINKGA